MIDVSTAYQSKIKEMTRTVNASIGIGDKLLTNYVVNSNFASGTTNWNINQGTATTSNGVITFTGNGTAYNPYLRNSTGYSVKVGDKVYMYCKVKATNAKCTRMGMFTYAGLANVYSAQINNPVMNQEYTLSGISVQDINGTMRSYYNQAYATATDANGSSMELRQPFTINLTEVYGAGNEPTKEYMDSLMDKVGWFDGSKRVPDVFLENRRFNNIIPNGNFSDGFNGWYSVYGTSTVANNEVTYRVDTLSSSARIEYPYDTNIVGHKYYCRGSIYPKYATPTRIQIGGVTKNSATLTTNMWNTVSGVITAIATTRFRFYHLTDYNYAINDTVKYKDIMVIDLTAIYGSGNEPTQEYMDNLITTYGWFNTLNLLQSQTGDKSIIEDFTIESSSGAKNLPSIGSVPSSKLSLSLINDARIPQVLVGVPIRPYVAIDVGNGVYEWVKLGTFYAEHSDVAKTKLKTELEAFDKVASYDTTEFSTTLTLPLKVSQVIAELTSRYGVTFAKQSGLPDPNLTSVPSGTIRQVIGDMALLMTTNAVSDENGDIKFIFATSSGFSLDKTNYIDFRLTPESSIKISQIQCKVGDNTLSTGDNSGFALVIESNQVTSQADLDGIFNRNFPYTYYAYTLRSQGMPHLQVGDTISLSYLNVDGTTSTITIPIFYHKLTFNGGLRSEFKAQAPTQTTTSISVTSGSVVGNAIDQTYSDIISAMTQAMKTITGNEGGNVITILDGNNKPIEFVISDNSDINQAKNVWRWNAGGLLFSSDGYAPSDPTKVKIAITSAGEINASMVSTGVMNANLIKAGKLQSVNGLSWIDMTNGTFSFGGKVTWDGTNFAINYSGTSLEQAINNKANASELTGMKTYMAFGDNDMTIGKTGSPQQMSIDNASLQFLDFANATEITTTSISASGGTVTINFATQPAIPFPVGSYVELTGVVPTVYNDTWLVTACTTSQVKVTSTATGTVTTQGKVKVGFKAKENAVAWINGRKMYIKDVIATNSMTVGNHNMYKYDDNITLIKYVG